MRFITRETDYSLRALVYLAGRLKGRGEKIISVEALAKQECLPKVFLRRLLQRLAREKILTSSRGKGGGFSFVKSPDKIRLSEVMSIFQGPLDLTHCFLGKKSCPKKDSCGLRKRLRTISGTVEEKMREITISSLL